MSYVQRDSTGLIVGIFENMQPGVAEEFVSGDVTIDPQPLTYKQALDALNLNYQADIAKLNNAFALTLLADGPSEATKMAAIRAQYEARKIQHAANVAALKLQYGV
ncbi:DNA-directed RNA polymerase [Pseudomonas phage vB_PsaM_M1]|nr:DNA-directed RNA polymerase [Pseudomonas phage vB_PsaM_M1]